MPTKYHLVYRKNVVKCAACGCDCTWIKSHNGKSQLTPVGFDERRGDWFFATTGNYGNFRQVHNCIADAEKNLAVVEADLARLGPVVEIESLKDAKEAFRAKWSEGFLATLSATAREFSWDKILDERAEESARNTERLRLASSIASRKARIQEMREKLSLTTAYPPHLDQP